MKTLELKLKKDVLIVEIPRLADYEFINRECKYLIVGKEEIKLNASTLDKFEVLCKGSELTEEIASELVEEHYMNGIRSYEIYKDYRYNDSRWLDNAIDSFISAVESKGFYWLRNPIDKPNKYLQRCMSFENLSNQFKLFDEKEEKTFRNPVIFVKKS
jgi:hypothetical protein